MDDNDDSRLMRRGQGGSQELRRCVQVGLRQAEQARGAGGALASGGGGLGASVLTACQPGSVTVTFPGSQHPPTEGPHPGFSPLEPPTFPRGPGDEMGAGHG